MYRVKEVVNIVSAVKQFESREISPNDLITKVCNYFDLIKDEDLSESDKKFLLFLSSKAGVPHYYDMLFGFNKENDVKISNIGLNTFSSLLYESTLYTDNNVKLHRQQKEVLNRFSNKKQNRYFLSASTSFGKTFLAYEIIKKMKYKNVVLIFPTIALLAENLERLKEDDNYKYFSDYTVHTLSDFIDDEIKEKNIFIFTPERFLSFLDKNSKKINFDFVFVDEVYKIDNEYLIEQESKENERDLAYRMAVSFALSTYNNIDVLLAGPYINFHNNIENGNRSFHLFLEDFNIELIDKNECEIVNKSIYPVLSSIKVDNLNFILKKSYSKSKKLEIVLDEIIREGENIIVYCSSRSSAELNALKMINSGVNKGHNYTDYYSFINHLENEYGTDWVVTKALKFGIGVHHGLVPKYIQKEIIKLFNDGYLNILFSTTTITEGVNTSAKNIFIFYYKKGNKLLQPFDAKNIIGRAGRFLRHYSGRVFYLNKEFSDILNSKSDIIKHKNYDKDSIKGDVDIDITGPEYLTDQEKEKKENIKKLQESLNIPEDIMQQFKVISREDKIFVYKQICALSKEDHRSIKILIKKINSDNLKIDFDGFQLILNLLLPKINNKNLRDKIENKFKSQVSGGLFSEYSSLVFLINRYLSKGFTSLYEGNFGYRLDKFKEAEKEEKKEQCVNGAMRDTSNLVYNIFKYQLVKYLGLFNIIYKFEKSKRLNRKFDEVSGIDKLLSKLEYNAFSSDARLASDYGVTDNIIKYFDTKPDKRNNIKFDNFEKELLSQVKKIINKEDE